MGNYYIELSQEADKDLQEIFDYTHQMHGVEQAERYVSSFDQLFQQLAAYPESGRERKEIKIGLRCIVKEYHLVFYRIIEDRIRIIRILHGARDLPRQF